MTGKKPLYIYTAVIYFAALVLCMALNLVGACLNDIMTFYDIPLENGGIMSMLQYVGGIGGIIVMLIIIDRMRKGVVLIAVIAVSAAALLLIGTAPGVNIFLPLYILLGAGICSIDVSSNSILSDIHSENRNAALSIHHGVCGLGATIIPFLSIGQSGSGWNGTYNLVGIALLIVLALNTIIYIIFRKPIDGKCYIKREVTKSKPSGSFFKNKYVWVAFISTLLFGACQSGATVWGVKYCQDMFAEQGAFACAFALSAYWIGTTICRILTGIVPRLAGMDSKKMIIIGGITGGAAFVIGVISQNYYGFIVGVLIMGFLSAPLLPRTISLVSGWYPDNSGLATGSQFIALYLGYAVVPLVMGNVAAASGMTVMMMIPAVATVAAGVVGFLLPKK